MAFPGLIKANNLSDVANKEKAWDNLGINVSTGDIAIATPSLDLNFAANKNLIDSVSGNNLITFSRASIGTFLGSDGRIQTAGVDTPRFNHDPVTGQSLGLLMEEARTNYFWNYASPGNADGTRIYSTYSDARFGSEANAHSWTFLTAIQREISWFLDINTAGNGIQYTFSFWAKANQSFTMTGEISDQRRQGIIFNAGLTTEWQYFTYSTPANIPDNGSNGAIYFWLLRSPGFTPAGLRIDLAGANLERGGCASSYILTSGSAASRATDVASITGNNFSSWYNNANGTFFTQAILAFSSSGGSPFTFGGVSYSTLEGSVKSLSGQFLCGGLPNSFTSLNKIAVGLESQNYQVVVNGSSAGTATTSYVPVGTEFRIQSASGSKALISRLTYWPVRLGSRALKIITEPLLSSFDSYSFNYTIKGKDVLALNAVRNTSARDFVFIRGLTSPAQTRLTSITQSAASAVALSNTLLLKQSPSSVGNYLVASGTLNASQLKINNAPFASLSSSPFSGSTALFPLIFTTMELSSNFRLVPSFAPGTITSPTVAVPIETNDLYLYAKAGQS